MGDRYKRNYMGNLVDNTKDWEYKPTQKEDEIRLLNKYDGEYKKLDELFNKLGLGNYSYSLLEKVLEFFLESSGKKNIELLENVDVTEEGKVICNDKSLNPDEVAVLLESQSKTLWGVLKENEKLEKNMEIMQQKINLLYIELTMTKEHMTDKEWSKFKERKEELEKQVGINWVRL